MAGRSSQRRIHWLIGMEEIGARVAGDLDRALEPLLHARERVIDKEELAGNRRLELDDGRAPWRDGNRLDVADRWCVE